MIVIFLFFYFMKNKTIRSLILVGNKKIKLDLSTGPGGEIENYTKMALLAEL